MVSLPLIALPASAVPGSDSKVFINEFHYDNTGADVGEFIEVAGPAGTDLTGWSVVLYNGANGQSYGTLRLSGVLTDQQGGYGTHAVDAVGLQNGDPDGMALVKGSDVVQFLSYEGTMTATNGPASGMTSTDVGVSQSGSEPVGSSLQLAGSGSAYGSFSWTKTNGSNTKGLPNAGQTFGGGTTPPDDPPPPEQCTGDAPRIHEIQGTGDRSPLLGQSVTVQAVVTAVKPGLSGYYVQEEPEDVDADPATSEGVFVFAGGSAVPVDVGQTVRLTGKVGEYTTTGSSQTQLTNATVVECDVPPVTIAPTAVSFPLDDPSDLERYEGMLVELVDTLVVSEYFNYDRFGEVVVAKPLEGLDRLFTPTAVAEPGPEAQSLAAEYAKRTITVDDSSSKQNPNPIPHPGNGEPFGNDNTFRGGDTITGLQGVVDNSHGLYRVQPTTYGEYAQANPRPSSAPDVGGSVKVASFNVLNYFLTLDRSGNRCGPAKNQDCRGANSAAELQRQRAKIVSALAELDADVVGLMEMENTTGVEPAADLVAGLNDKLGAGTYDYIDTGVIGTDAIRLGFLYKPGAVRPVGDFAVLDSSVDPRFDDSKNRPMLTQTFDEVGTDGRFTVSVNHLKSKGSACAGDPDTGDGQGNCNITRTRAAQAIADYLAGDPTRSGDPDHLVIGDLNSYDHEDPIKALVDAGYTDEVKRFGGEYAYGYVFDGMAGYLDHGLANRSLNGQVTGAQEWHINADEPDALDYNLDFGRPADWYSADPYRSSDHDPVLIGLDLTPAQWETCYADDSQTVVSYTPGKRANGTAVPAGHAVPGESLGLSDPNPDEPYYVTLGLGGELVMEFARPVQNLGGDRADLRVVDAVDGAKGAGDAALVYGSWDGDTWVALGRVSGTGEVDLGELSAARYIKVVDDTAASGGRLLPANDGFDLDAVEVRSGCA
jgi:predicted extracellular nuclease